jgi:hypothetical protein
MCPAKACQIVKVFAGEAVPAVVIALAIALISVFDKGICAAVDELLELLELEDDEVLKELVLDKLLELLEELELLDCVVVGGF